MDKTDKHARFRVFVFCVITFFVGYWLASSSASTPFGPGRKPRPVLAALVKAAKNLLWVSLVFEPPPTAVESRVVMSPQIGEDGYPIVDHGRGW